MFRKSSYSNYNGECVEVDDWRKSTFSQGVSNCVEAASGVAVRDNTDRDGPVLVFTPAAWARFTESVRGL